MSQNPTELKLGLKIQDLIQENSFPSGRWVAGVQCACCVWEGELQGVKYFSFPLKL